MSGGPYRFLAILAKNVTDEWPDGGEVLIGFLLFYQKMLLMNELLYKMSLTDLVHFKIIPNTDVAYAINTAWGNNILMYVNMYILVSNQRKNPVYTLM